ncbi:MAG: hypothetical protein B6U87_01245 [Candidatus Aenigmarchaeota archaeon ex4484_52]|nr:MAG: hypothetical protein B6U87_01245 [Candidatus Aenigmarchaeota archaeon ex4484_52]
MVARIEQIEKRIILENAIKKDLDDLPECYRQLNLSDFGFNIKLYEYQQQALKNILNVLHLYFSGKNKLFEKYKNNGLDEKLEKQLDVEKGDENFNFLKEHYEVELFYKIPFINFINRASLWMATGSGKTLVMIKLIELLYHLMKQNQIPKKDILLLAPKDTILNQIKEHIDIFNSRGQLYINLIDLRKREGVFQQRTADTLNVFYYRADNITEQDKDKQINYKTFCNNGNWYIILDEAHRGDKQDSKRQQYYTAMSKNGFLFNFSATFVDLLDITTTAFNFNLKKFINAGYGKKIYIANSEFKYFRRIERDFKDEEQRKIILKSLIVFSIIKNDLKEIRQTNNLLYHNPLMITVANTVNTMDADLKIFFEQLIKIANSDLDIEDAKKELNIELRKTAEYQLTKNELNNKFLEKIENITIENIRENIFNSRQKSNIEVIKVKNNTRELAFRIKSSGKYFALLVVSDAFKWQDNVLNGYELGQTIDKSLFKNINDKDNEINLLMGNKIFSEGWDSNRPNVINFINIGISNEAKKFVLQTIGRGVRIEPIKDERKRLKYIEVDKLNKTEIQKINQSIESLFVFATNKEVIKNILKDLEKNNIGWKIIKGIKKTQIPKDKKLFVPKYEETGELNNIKFKINSNDYEKIKDYFDKASDRILLIKDDINLRTIEKLKNEENFEKQGKKLNIDSIYLIKKIHSHFNEKIKTLSGYEPIVNEIKHYEQIQTDLPEEELSRLEDRIKEILEEQIIEMQKKQLKPKETEDQIDNLFDECKITKEEYKLKIKELKKFENLPKSKRKTELTNLDYKLIKEHYYLPILLSKEGNYEKHFIHIIKAESEIKFLNKLEEYLKEKNNNLKNYNWWYFSKIEQNIDEIKIPYFNSNRQEFSNFYPDFIFWLKKKEDYFIVFVDPKGTEHLTNPIDKINGFEKIKQNKKENINLKLFYFNEDKPSDEKYKKYWTNNLNEIF